MSDNTNDVNRPYSDLVEAYNDAVMGYNTARETFPTNLIAGPFNFGPAELFVIEKPEEKEAPKVSF